MANICLRVSVILLFNSYLARTGHIPILSIAFTFWLWKTPQNFQTAHKVLKGRNFK